MRDGHDAEDSRLGSVIARLLSRLGLPSPSASLTVNAQEDGCECVLRMPLRESN